MSKAELGKGLDLQLLTVIAGLGKGLDLEPLIMIDEQSSARERTRSRPLDCDG